MGACVFVCVCVCCVYVCMYACLYAWVRVCSLLCVFVGVCEYIYIYISMLVRDCMCVRACACACLCVCICMNGWWLLSLFSLLCKYIRRSHSEELTKAGWGLWYVGVCLWCCVHVLRSLICDDLACRPEANDGHSAVEWPFWCSDSFRFGVQILPTQE